MEDGEAKGFSELPVALDGGVGGESLGQARAEAGIGGKVIHEAQDRRLADERVLLRVIGRIAARTSPIERSNVGRTKFKIPFFLQLLEGM